MIQPSDTSDSPPPPSALSDFDARSDRTNAPPPAQVTDRYTEFFYNILPCLPVPMLEALRERICHYLPPSAGSGASYGAEYDIKVEIEGLIAAVRAMQDTVMQNGRIRSGITPKEMKDVVHSSASLISLLVKAHEKFLGFDRMRTLEMTTIEVLRDLGGEEVAERFVEMMEERLAEALK